jgi:hypothetical protein
VHADNSPQSLGAGIKVRVLEKLAHEVSRIVITYVQPYQAIRIMAESLFEEILVLCEERDRGHSVENRDDVVILDSPVTNVLANLPKWNSPNTELF